MVPITTDLIVANCWVPKEHMHLMIGQVKLSPDSEGGTNAEVQFKLPVGCIGIVCAFEKKEDADAWMDAVNVAIQEALPVQPTPEVVTLDEKPKEDLLTAEVINLDTPQG